MANAAIESLSFANGYKGAKVPLVGAELDHRLPPSIHLRDFLFNLLDFNTELPRNQHGGVQPYDAELFFRTVSRSTPILVMRGAEVRLDEAEVNRNRISAVYSSRLSMYGPNSSDRPEPVSYLTGRERLVLGKPPAGVGVLQPVVFYNENLYAGDWCPRQDNVQMEYLGEDISKKAFMTNRDYSEEGHERAERLQAEKVLDVATHIARLLGSEEFS